MNLNNTGRFVDIACGVRHGIAHVIGARDTSVHCGRIDSYGLCQVSIDFVCGGDVVHEIRERIIFAEDNLLKARY